MHCVCRFSSCLKVQILWCLELPMSQTFCTGTSLPNQGLTVFHLIQHRTHYKYLLQSLWWGNSNKYLQYMICEEGGKKVNSKLPIILNLGILYSREILRTNTVVITRVLCDLHTFPFFLSIHNNSDRNCFISSSIWQFKNKDKK